MPLKKTDIPPQAVSPSSDDASRLRARFLAAFNHELRTPLNSIIGFSELMKGSGARPMPVEKYIEYADHIFKSSKHLLDLINGIIDYSEIDSAADDIAGEAMDPVDLISGAIDGVSAEAQAREIAIRMEMAEGLPWVRVDSHRMAQVLAHVLRNAIKFSPPASTVTVSACRLSGTGGLGIDIADHGIGIDGSELGKVFEPFFQSGEPYLRETAGNGLGLAISKALIEAHQGSINIRSAKNEGTVVSISLPEARLIESGLPEAR